MTTPGDHDQADDDVTGAGDETSTMEITGTIGTTPPEQPASRSVIRRLTATNGEA